MALPTLFLSHGGGPGFFMKVEPRSPFADISKDSEACKLFKGVGMDQAAYGLPPRPDAIVIISAHWETSDAFHVLHTSAPGLIYDYYGFPAETYELEYPAPGHPKLAERIVSMINSANLKRKAVLDAEREGYDHGVFLPLLLLYPDASIPIVQISLHSALDPEDHLSLGRTLTPLRSENILIVGSGQTTHPMGPGCTPAKTDEFVKMLNDVVLTPMLSGEERMTALTSLFRHKLVRETHIPRSEHLTPLAVALGAAEGAGGRDLFNKDKDLRFMGGIFSLASYVFGFESGACKSN